MYDFKALNWKYNSVSTAKKKGFTLIELLVVIAIIALLLAILTPALTMVKNRAQAVVCMSNLKQWGLIFGLYLQNNKSNFPLVTMDPADEYDVWVEPLRPYYTGGGEKMRVCPTATKPETEGGRGSFIAWDQTWTNPLIGITEVYRGSYGINNWVYNCPDDAWWGMPTVYNWRRDDVKQANQIPLFMDCWRWGGSPTDTDLPYLDPPQTTLDYLHGMNRFCLDRHNKSINILFVDLTVKKVRLKDLWKQKWHKNFDTHNDMTKDDADWPTWMN